MLGVSQYRTDYVEACRAQVRAQLDAYEKLVTGNAHRQPFETLFLRNMILVLEQCFVHRLRGQEGKDGNPLNEVRMVAGSILGNNSRFMADKTIKWSAEKSVLKLEIGDEITLGVAEFALLAEAYFAAIKARFPEKPEAN